MAAAKGVLNLKVTLVETGKTAVMKFMGFMSVAEAGVEIFEKTKTGGPDHGIFLVSSCAGIAGQKTWMWLNPMKTLNSYDLKNGDQLLWKKKNRPIKVCLLDGSVKAILLDESLPIHQLVERIGEAINLTNPEEFSLKVEGQTKWLN